MKDKETEIKLGADIINTYQPYRNDATKHKKIIISGQAFEIDERYDIIDVSNNVLMQLDKVPLVIQLPPGTRKPKKKKENLLRLKDIKMHYSIKYTPNVY